MSTDILSDTLNQMMNAKKSGKTSVSVNRHSKLLLNVLAIGKLKGYISDYKVEGNKLDVEFAKLNFCKAVKPRYVVKIKDLEKYIRRYLPARDFGIVIVSTSKGLMTHQTAYEKGIGGSVIAYFY